jgi:hypothetical protein
MNATETKVDTLEFPCSGGPGASFILGRLQDRLRRAAATLGARIGRRDMTGFIRLNALRMRIAEYARRRRGKQARIVIHHSQRP